MSRGMPPADGPGGGEKSGPAEMLTANHDILARLHAAIENLSGDLLRLVRAHFFSADIFPAMALASAQVDLDLVSDYEAVFNRLAHLILLPSRGKIPQHNPVLIGSIGYIRLTECFISFRDMIARGKSGILELFF